MLRIDALSSAYRAAAAPGAADLDLDGLRGILRRLAARAEELDGQLRGFDDNLAEFAGELEGLAGEGGSGGAT